MRRNRQRRNVAIIVGILILAIVIILFFMPSSKEEKHKNFIEIESDNAHTTDDIVSETNIEPEVTEHKEEPVVQPKKEPVLCEDYLMQQGDKIILDGYIVELQKIATSSVKLSVNGRQLILSEGEYEKEDGLGLEIQEGKLVYFEDGSEENQIQIRIGCAKGMTPKDKIVEDTLKESGILICTQVKDVCYESFEKPSKYEFENITKYDFCDDYNLKQSESKKLGDFEISVEKISKDNSLININGNGVILAQDEYKRVNDLGIKLTNLGFFGEDDSDNQVTLEIGCAGNEQLNSEYIDDHIWSKANSACKDLIELCEEKFDVKIE